MDTGPKFKVILTKEDLASAIRKNYISQFNSRALLVLLLLAIPVVLSGMVPPGWQIPAIFLILLAAGGLGYTYFISPAIAAGRIEQDKEFGRETLWSIQPDGVALLSSSSRRKLKWDKFRDFMETHTFFLLLRADDRRVFQIIPKRSFESTEQLDAFRELLKEHFPGHGRPSWLPRWRSVLIVAVVVILVFLLSFALGRMGQ